MADNPTGANTYAIRGILDDIIVLTADAAYYAEACRTFEAYGTSLVLSKQKRHCILKVCTDAGYQPDRAEAVVCQLESLIAVSLNNGWVEFALRSAPAFGPEPMPNSCLPPIIPDAAGRPTKTKGGHRDRTSPLHAGAQHVTWVSADTPLPVDVQKAAPNPGCVISKAQARVHASEILTHLVTYCGRHPTLAQKVEWALVSW